MKELPQAGIETARAAAGKAEKRVILSMGGKGGVGKTSVMAALAEWFEVNEIPVKLLDLDTENKARGSLTHFFDGCVPKVNIHTPAGLDAFVDHLADGAPVVLADMGAGSGQITYDWFEKMYPDVAEAGIKFTTIGVVTSDPASVESVLAWAARLQNRVEYLIVENSITDHADFTYWRESDQARKFCEAFAPAVIQMDYRLAELENAARNHGVTLGERCARASGGIWRNNPQGQRDCDNRQLEARAGHDRLHQSMTLTADEFLRRFLLHTLPRGFVRIRFFGFMTHRRRAALLPVCRNLLEASPQQDSPAVETARLGKGPAWLCPLCRGPMVVIERFTAQQIFLHHSRGRTLSTALDRTMRLKIAAPPVVCLLLVCLLIKYECLVQPKCHPQTPRNAVFHINREADRPFRRCQHGQAQLCDGS